jgi:hypothetical protein
MAKLHFFTAISYPVSSKPTSSLQIVDDYFYLGGRKAYVINPQKEVVLAKARSSLCVSAIKVFSYCTILIPLIMLIAKAALRSQHRFTITDPQHKLEEGMTISEGTIAKIQQLIPQIIKQDDKDPDIEWVGTGRNLVFRLKECPDIVFKIAAQSQGWLNGKPVNPNDLTHQRFANMIKAKSVCLINNLDSLEIPQAKKFDVKDKDTDSVTYTVIAEQRLEISPHEGINEELHYTHFQQLNQTIRQLAIFVAKTGFNDLAFRNIPLIHDYKKIALIDLEDMENAHTGFLGAYRRRGLVDCASSEEQINIVIAEAHKQGAITKKEAKEAKKSRLKQLEEDQKLRTFYEGKGIVNGKEPIQCEFDSLGLDLKETYQMGDGPITLGEVLKEFIDEINTSIAKSCDTESIKTQRDLVLRKTMVTYGSIPCPMDKIATESTIFWLERITQALIDHGHIFKLVTTNGHGYHIQA